MRLPWWIVADYYAARPGVQAARQLEAINTTRIAGADQKGYLKAVKPILKAIKAAQRTLSPEDVIAERIAQQQRKLDARRRRPREPKPPTESHLDQG